MLEVNVWYQTCISKKIRKMHTCISLIDNDRCFSSTKNQFDKANANLDKCWKVLIALGFYQYFDSISFLVCDREISKETLYKLFDKNIIYKKKEHNNEKK